MKKIADRLQDDGRVINTSSYMHHFAKVKDLDFGFENNYHPGLAYNNSKLYTIWMTRYLARDFFLKGSNITINAYHPGLISTNLGNNSSDEKTKKSLFGRLMKSLSKDLDQGIETGYYLTLSEEVRGLTGYYFDEKKVNAFNDLNTMKNELGKTYKEIKENKPPFFPYISSI